MDYRPGIWVKQLLARRPGFYRVVAVRTYEGIRRDRERRERQVGQALEADQRLPSPSSWLWRTA
jgi:hypothetical protein